MEYRQSWEDVLFLHWAVPVEALHKAIPPPLEVATHAGRAWVSAVLFRLRVRPRWFPFVPGVSQLAELNLRTYVHCRGVPGVWFLRVLADNRPAAWLARQLTPIPYTWQPLRYRLVDAGFEFRNRPGPPALAFRPTGPAAEVECGSLDEWLLERYRMFASARSGLMTAEVIHPRWVVRAVEAAGGIAEIGRVHGLDLDEPPVAAHFSAGVRADFGPFRPVSRGELVGVRARCVAGSCPGDFSQPESRRSHGS